MHQFFEEELVVDDLPGSFFIVVLFSLHPSFFLFSSTDDFGLDLFFEVLDDHMLVNGSFLCFGGLYASIIRKI